MARPLRIQYPEATYHVMSRGNGGRTVYRSKEDYLLFLNTLGQACERAALVIHAFVLMRNHYHLLLETPHGNLVEGMQWLQQTFTQRYNARHQRRGHLFQGRYRAQIIEPESDDRYFLVAANYIHLNPARARLIGQQKPMRKLANFEWSSFPGYLQPKSKRPPWLEVNRVLGEYDLRDTLAGRRTHGQILEECVDQEEAERRRDRKAYEKLRRGWCLGGEGFRKALTEMAQVDATKESLDLLEKEAARDVTKRAAETLIEQALAVLGIAEEELPAMKKSDERKLLIAWLVKRRTTVSNRWLSSRLHMGHYTNTSNAARRIEETHLRQVKVLRSKLEKF